MLTARWHSICNCVAIATCVVSACVAGSAFARDPSALTSDQIAFVFTLLERDARTSADAGFLLYVLYSEPGDILKQGWAKFGRGEQWLDWWLVLHPMPRRPLDRDSYFDFIDWCDESEMHAVEERPEILRRILRASLYLQGLGPDLKPQKEAITIGQIKEAWLDWKGLASLENQSDGETGYAEGYHDREAGRVCYWCRHVNSLRCCYWLFGRGDEVKKVTNYTWKREYLAFRKWLVENEPYLRFQKTEDRFTLDLAAKKAKQPVPQDARQIPPPTAPFPDWKDDLPTVYDYDLMQGSSGTDEHRETSRPSLNRE